MYNFDNSSINPYIDNSNNDPSVSNTQNAQNVMTVSHLDVDPRFYDNLVPYISPGELERIGNQLTEAISADDNDRKKWLRILTDGITQLGIGGERAPSTDVGKDSDLYATTFLTECLKISSKVFSTLFPYNDFAKTKLYGFVTKELQNQADNTQEFFNLYTNEVMTEYIPDSQQAIWWSVLGGSSFVKPYFDPHKGRIVAPYIMPQHIIISSGASSIADAERVTHRFTLTKRQVEANFDKKIWINTKGSLENKNQPYDSVTRKIHQVTGTDPSLNEENQIYEWDECYTFIKINGFEEVDQNGMPTPRYLPYRVCKATNSNNIVGIFRNYDQFDLLFKAQQRIIQHKYFTGFNAYGLGMIHLCLGAAKTETKIQQQILKGAILSNVPNLVQKSGLRTERTQFNFTPGSIPQVQTFGEPLENVFYKIPFVPPSPIMMELKNSCSQDIQNISIAQEIRAENIPANTSATTILGILSTSNDMPNSLIKSYYRSYTKELQLIYDLLGKHLPDTPYPFLTSKGSSSIMKQDFNSNIKIFPVMDPSQSSQSMQLITNEILMNLSSAYPDLYNKRELQSRILDTLKIQDKETLLIPDPTENPPPELDPISENMRVYQNQPIKVYKAQDHKAHMAVHDDEINKLSQDQSRDNSLLVSSLNAHQADHQMWDYANEMEAMTGINLPDDASQIPPDIQNQIAVKAAQTVQQKQQQAQQNTPQPMDPSIPLMEENRVKEKGIELEAEYKQEQIKTEQIKIEKEYAREEVELQIKLRQLELEEKKLSLEERRLMFQETESERKQEIELKKIEIDNIKNNLQIEAKSFGDTLKYESDRTKTELDVQSKSFDTVMSHNNETESDQPPTKKETQNGTVNRKE